MQTAYISIMNGCSSFKIIRVMAILGFTDFWYAGHSFLTLVVHKIQYLNKQKL